MGTGKFFCIAYFIWLASRFLRPAIDLLGLFFSLSDFLYEELLLFRSSFESVAFFDTLSSPNNFAIRRPGDLSLPTLALVFG